MLESKHMVTTSNSNPYKIIPVPLPLYGWRLSAPDIFIIEVLSERIHINRGWLAAQPRTTRQVDSALFPDYEMGGMTRAEVFEQLNAALWEAGFRPDQVKENAEWTLPKDAVISKDKLGDLWKGNAADDFKV